MSDELILAISGNDIFSGGGLHADLARLPQINSMDLWLLPV